MMEGGDALLDGQETLALLQRQQLVVHLGLPEIAPLVPGDDLLRLQQLAQSGEAGLIDEHVLFLLVQGAQELADGLGGALDRLLQNGNPLQQMLVEREALLGRLLIGVVVLTQRAREHQQLLVATDAILVVVPVGRATDLAIHSSSLSSVLSSGCNRRTPSLISFPAALRRPSSPTADTAGIWDLQILPGAPA